MALSIRPPSRADLNESGGAADAYRGPSARSRIDGTTRFDNRSHYNWLLPWVLACVGFLATLAMLR